MRERLKHKYALSEQGVNDMIKAVIIDRKITRLNSSH